DAVLTDQVDCQLVVGGADLGGDGRFGVGDQIVRRRIAIVVELDHELLRHRHVRIGEVDDLFALVGDRYAVGGRVDLSGSYLVDHCGPSGFDELRNTVQE